MTDEGVLGEFHQGPQTEIQSAIRPDIRLQPFSFLPKHEILLARPGGVHIRKQHDHFRTHDTRKTRKRRTGADPETIGFMLERAALRAKAKKPYASIETPAEKRARILARMEAARPKP